MQHVLPSVSPASTQRRSLTSTCDRASMLLPRTAERYCCPRTTFRSAAAGFSSSRPSAATAASQSELASSLTATAMDSTQQTGVPTATTSVRVPTARSPFTTTLPVASITRILIVMPQNLLRNLVQRRWPSVSGPVSLLLFIFGMALAAWAAVRAALVRRVRRCSGCRGYGIVRCNLCAGHGQVDWRAKFSYSDSCPLCMSKRFIECPDCGGHYHRPLFSHARRNGGGFAPQN